MPQDYKKLNADISKELQLAMDAENVTRLALLDAQEQHNLATEKKLALEQTLKGIVILAKDPK